eukprot:g33135.t1
MLLNLPWSKAIKGARKAFARRSQLIFIHTHLLRPLPPETTSKEDVATQTVFADGCAKLCAELMISLEASEDKAASQQKLRKECLHTLKAIHKLRQKSGGLPPEISDAIAEALASFRDSLPQKRGEVYNLCIHLLPTA